MSGGYVHSFGLVTANENIEKVLRYCEPNLDQMWAALIVGTLLECDFRDAKRALNEYWALESQAEDSSG